MEQYLVCENCKTLFNLSNRKPIIFIECLDTVCLECVLSVVLKNQVSENQFKCCLNEDHIDKENLDDLKINTTILRNLQSQKNLPIFCEVHKNQIAQFLIQNENKLICDVCLIQIQHDNGENQEVREINKIGMKRYASQSIELLEKGVNQLNGQLIKLRKIQEDSLNLNAIEAIDLLQSNQKLFQMIEGDKVESQLMSSKLVKENFKLYPEKNQPQELLDQLLVQENEAQNIIHQNLNINQNYQQLLANFYRKVALEINKIISFFKKYIKNQDTSTLQIIYRGSRDGLNPQSFHEKCDCKGPTITFLLSEHGNISGFYTSVSLRYLRNTEDLEFFVFQLDHKTVHRPRIDIKVRIDSDQTYLKFGYLHSKYDKDYKMRQDQYYEIELVQIQNDLLVDAKRFNEIFEIPNFKDIDRQKSYLGGSETFKILETEVYQFN